MKPAMPTPPLCAICLNYGRAIIPVRFIMLIPSLHAIHPNYSWTIFPMKLTMLIPPLRTVCFD
jgi:hypothetical protein